MWLPVFLVGFKNITSNQTKPNQTKPNQTKPTKFNSMLDESILQICQIVVAICNLANTRAISCWQFVLLDSYSLKIINFDLLWNLEQTLCLRLNKGCILMILPDKEANHVISKNLKYIHLSTPRFLPWGRPSKSISYNIKKIKVKSSFKKIKKKT